MQSTRAALVLRCHQSARLPDAPSFRSSQDFADHAIFVRTGSLVVIGDAGHELLSQVRVGEMNETISLIPKLIYFRSINRHWEVDVPDTVDARDRVDHLRDIRFEFESIRNVVDQDCHAFFELGRLCRYELPENVQQVFLVAVEVSVLLHA